jgi:transcriptional regulator of acetoin/glycerol metabolism
MKVSDHISRIEAALSVDSQAHDGPISRSWRRCATSFRIDPAAAESPHILTESVLSMRREAAGTLIEAARTEMDRLYQIVRPARYVVLLTDPDAVVIDHRGTGQDAEEFKRRGQWLGRIWSETVEGTNGIGTALLDGQPVTIHCSEHFRLRHAGLSCSGAPIFDGDGRVVGLIDVSSFDQNVSVHAHTMTGALTIAVARGIGERLFRAKFRRHWVITLACPTAPNGAALLAVDRDRRIVAANAEGRTLLEQWGHPPPYPFLWSVFRRNESIFRSSEAGDRSANLSSLADDETRHAIVTPPLPAFVSKAIAGADDLHLRPRMDRLLAGTPSPIPDARGGMADPSLRRVRDYVENHLNGDVSLGTLARVAGLSDSHFARAFRQAEGVTPHTYVLQRRVARARKMMVESDLSLAEIALAAGFADQSHLARRFRQQTGLTPDRFRKLHRESPL